jgi:RNA polymerase sigma factor (sigma-70 family)
MALSHPATLLHHIHRLAEPPTEGPVPDADLLARFVRDRDEAAFAALFARHAALVLRVCRHVLGNTEEAEDCAQAAFLVLARRAGSLRRPAALAGWLHGVALRVALKARTAARRRPPTVLLPVEEVVDHHADPLDTLTARELLLLVEAEIARLPEAYRLPVVLCDHEGRTVQEAARLLGWTAGSVRGRLARGRSRLHARLTRRGLGLSAALMAVTISPGPAALVPAHLSGPTVRAALAFAGGETAASAGVSAKVAALAEDGVKGMVLSKAKLTLVLVLAASVAVAGTGMVAHEVLAVKQPAAEKARAPQPMAGDGRRAQPEDDKAVRNDRYGDPLPDGAVVRIGTSRLQGNEHIYVAAYSPDAKLLATGAFRKALLWDAKSGKLLLEMPLPVPPKPNYALSPVTTLAISPDGKRLVFGGYWSEFVCLWDVEAKKLLHTFDNWSEAAEKQSYVEEGPTLAFTPDSRVLVCGAKNGSVRLWDVESGRERARLTGSDQAVLGMGLSADGKTLLTADYTGKAHLWDLAGRKHLRSLDTAAKLPHSHRLAPDGQTFSYMTEEGVLIVRDTARGKVLHRLQGGPKALRLAYSPDSKALLMAGANGVVTAWDLRTGEKRKVAECRLAGPDAAMPPSGPNGAWFAPNGRSLAWDVGGTVRLWDLTAGAESPRLEGHRNAVWSVGFSADGRSLVTTSITGEVGGWDAATGAARRPIRAWLSWGPRTQLSADRCRAVSVTGETGRSRVPGPGEATIYLWEPFTDRPPVRLQGQTGPAYHAAFTPDGSSVIATHHDGTIGAYNAATGKQVRAIKGREYLYYPTFAPDGTTLATLASDSVLRLWDFGSGRELRNFATPAVGRCLAFSPDGKVIATGHEAGLERPGGPLPGPGDWLYLWEAASGKQLQRIRTEQSAVNAVEFSQDGRLIATGGRDGTVRLWEVVSGLERRRLKGHRYGVNAVAFSPDGRRLASGSDDGTALIWEVFDPGRPGPSAAKLAAWWDDLAGEPAKAHQSVGALAAAQSTAAFLAKRLRPVEAPDEKRLARLITGLNADRFQDREVATKELEGLRELAGPALRQALTKHPSAEASRRIERLLARLAGPLQQPEPLRAVRAVEVLELASSPEARQLLRSLAEGASEARLTQEAKAALKRLAQPASPAP